ncbi:hypothetical protein JAAARDRAFT_49389 [Jaapia argillacea MUCL 33604]|uniref:Uncharacterized protein n=1 Tax=Jaapia argillacea MUCL 33604 TaxID=933084 RepID=A0A067PI46_9AGAM|nr:hypothetical protein JAAARDRAFT_49389 [Jaapia argillacea MUCL 33604]
MAVCGVGPSVSTRTTGDVKSGTPTPGVVSALLGENLADRSYTSLVQKAKQPSMNIATDVWYFLVPLSDDRNTRPIELPGGGKILSEKPESPYVEKWRTWKCMSGMATTIRKHLKKDHGEMWRGVVITEKLKGWEELKAGCCPGLSEVGCNEHEPFSVEGFLDHLVKWIAVDDQSINVIESEELRDLLLFVGTKLKDGDIPHQMKLAQLLIERFRIETELLAHDMQNALRRIAFTADAWSDPAKRAHLGITGSWMSKKTIREGNEKNMFDVQLAKNELLQECETRWSSIMLMVDHTLELHPEVLRDVTTFLNVPHKIQEVLSAEKTPTAPLALPLYEMLLYILKERQKELPRIAHIIAAAI